jgi:hypothetical protein
MIVVGTTFAGAVILAVVLVKRLLGRQAAAAPVPVQTAKMQGAQRLQDKPG